MKKTLLLLLTIALPSFMFAQLTVSISTTNVSCNSVCDGSATANVTGGTAPYTYNWSPVGTTATITGLCAATYVVTVSDAAAATASATCTIVQPTMLNVTANVGPSPSICVGTNVAFSLMVSGGTPGYTYNWTFPGGMPGASSQQNPIVLYNTPGTFNAIGTVVDANGCIASVTITMTVSSGPTLAMSGIDPICNMASGQATATPTGISPFVYSWAPSGQVSQISTGLVAGGYTCTVTDANGCSNVNTIVLQDSCDFVWPGDANDDAVADNIDILDIGIANGATGTSRANATTFWVGQPSTAWGQTLLSGTDYKWVDCDGNGMINPVDTQAVVLNYGMLHNNRLIAPTWNALAPALEISFDQDSLMVGQTGTLTLSLGDTSDQAYGIYGIAFRLNYDAAQLSTPTFGMTGGATWFGTPGNDLMRVILHPNAANGYVDVAITRLDQQNVSGFGTLGQIYFTATNAMMGTGDTVEVPMTITNVLLVDNSGVSQLVNVINDELIVGDTGMFTSVTGVRGNEIVAYPNPANQTLQIQIPDGKQQLLVIEDMSGRVVYSQNHQSGASMIWVADLPGGVYLLRTTDPNGNSSTRKIVIAH